MSVKTPSLQKKKWQIDEKSQRSSLDSLLLRQKTGGVSFITLAPSTFYNNYIKRLHPQLFIKSHTYI